MALPCKNPCNEFKITACQHYTQCDGWLLPCGSSCFDYKENWDKIKKVASKKKWTIKECDLKQCKNKVKRRGF